MRCARSSSCIRRVCALRYSAVPAARVGVRVTLLSGWYYFIAILRWSCVHLHSRLARPAAAAATGPAGTGMQQDGMVAHRRRAPGSLRGSAAPWCAPRPPGACRQGGMQVRGWLAQPPQLAARGLLISTPASRATHMQRRGMRRTTLNARDSKRTCARSSRAPERLRVGAGGTGEVTLPKSVDRTKLKPKNRLTRAALGRRRWSQPQPETPPRSAPPTRPSPPRRACGVRGSGGGCRARQGCRTRRPCKLCAACSARATPCNARSPCSPCDPPILS